MFGSRSDYCTALALQYAREARAGQAIGQLFLKHRSPSGAGAGAGPPASSRTSPPQGGAPTTCCRCCRCCRLWGMLVKWAWCGEDATRRTPGHPPPPPPPHPLPGLCERAFTAHQLQNTVMPIMPFDVSTTSPPEACASELSHQLSSSHKCSSELSCSSLQSPVSSPQSPVPSLQYHSSASAPVQPGPDKARAPHISFP
jgi:hypothetical protein